MSRRDLISALEALVRVIDNADDLSGARRGAVLQRARAVAQRASAGFSTPVPWTPFEESAPVAATLAQVAMMMQLDPGLTVIKARELLELEMSETQLFTNSRYQVATRTNGNSVHLSIKRIDQASVHDWRDLQRIKDELVGPECEAVELYPAASRLVDTANQYHLWCVKDPNYRFPLGFNENLVRDAVSGGAHQRAREG